MIRFFKATACGNDYIYIDTRYCDDSVKIDQKNAVFAKIIDTEFQLGNKEAAIDEFSNFVKKVSERHFGIGSDGVVLISKSKVASVKMTIFNSDGTRGKMCGNALRVVAAYLSEKSSKTNYFTVETDSGIKKTFSKPIENSTSKYYSSVCLGKAECKNPPECVISVLQKCLKNQYLFAEEVNIGNNHLVVCLKSETRNRDDLTDNASIVNECQIIGLKSEIRDYPNLAKSICEKYNDGINIHFAVKNGNSIIVKHYERGSGYTLSCGTGAAAVASAFIRKGYFSENEKIKIASDGGEVSVLAHGSELFLSGQIEFICSGEILFD